METATFPMEINISDLQLFSGSVVHSHECSPLVLFPVWLPLLPWPGYCHVWEKESRLCCQRLSPPSCRWTGSRGCTHTTVPAGLARVQLGLILCLSSCLVYSHKNFWQAASMEGLNSSQKLFAESGLEIYIFPCNPAADKKYRPLRKTWL